jgi:hypothetical protein
MLQERPHELLEALGLQKEQIDLEVERKKAAFAGAEAKQTEIQRAMNAVRMIQRNETDQISLKILIFLKAFTGPSVDDVFAMEMGEMADRLGLSNDPRTAIGKDLRGYAEMFGVALIDGETDEDLRARIFQKLVNPPLEPKP